LSQFQVANNAVVSGTALGKDVTDDIDTRNSILQSLSSDLGVQAVDRPGGDVAIFTDSGVTLFDKTARSVTFQPTATYTAGTVGNAVYADGVPITSPNSALSVQSGKLVGLTTVRDSLAVTYQNQLDEIARGLISAFSETDQSGGGGPARQGLFIDPSSPAASNGGLAVPASGTVVPGLASQITINPTVDPSQGGNASLLRDGGISGAVTSGTAVYVYNATGATGYTQRLNQLIGNLTTAQTFSASSQLNTSTGVTDFASGSVSWLETQRQSATNASTYRTTLQQTASTALSNGTGVNLDDQLSQLITLEQSYQASAKLISTVNSLYQSLFNAV
jgi:flagellar hook-associated protein 1 FlgK